MELIRCAPQTVDKTPGRQRIRHDNAMHNKTTVADRRVHRGRKATAWRDPRLLIGAILIVFSVLLTAWIVEQARSGEELYQLTQPIPAGQKITVQSLMMVKARTGSNAYLQAGQLEDGAIATRSLAAGELLPRSAVSNNTELSRRQLVINISGRIPSTVEIGESVELWAITEADSAREQAQPQLVCEDAIVLKIMDSVGGLSASRSQGVEISVPQENLSEVLAVTGARVRLTIVPKG